MQKVSESEISAIITIENSKVKGILMKNISTMAIINSGINIFTKTGGFANDKKRKRSL